MPKFIPYRYILIEKFNNKIEKHLQLSEITDMVKEYKEYYNVYNRILVIHMVATVKVLLKLQKTLIYQEKLANDGSNNIMKKVLIVYFQIMSENHT